MLFTRLTPSLPQKRPQPNAIVRGPRPECMSFRTVSIGNNGTFLVLSPEACQSALFAPENCCAKFVNGIIVVLNGIVVSRSPGRVPRYCRSFIGVF